MSTRFPAVTVCLFLVPFLASCGDGTTSPDPVTGGVVPMYADDNGNGINDYFESAWHGVQFAAAEEPGEGYTWRHRFQDRNGDGICDRAQDGSPAWHGPGFVDADGDGICDYWDEDSPDCCTGEGLQYRDRNRNRVNDHFEARWHEGNAHGWVDADGDGICDRAQDGGPAWHGPGFVDGNGDGICDHWQAGGRGYGHHRGRG